MPGYASLDRILAILVVALAATGLASLWAGRTSDAWLFATHGVLAGMLATAVVLKVRRSVPRAVRARRPGRLVLGLVLTVAASGALAAGYLWVAAGTVAWVDIPSLGRWTVLAIHAWVGLALLPLGVLHLVPTRWRLLRPRAATRGGPLVSRRHALGAGLLASVGLLIWAAAGLLGRTRAGATRFTGSRWLTPGSLPIPTTFLGEPVPSVQPGRWRLTVERGDALLAAFDLARLRSLAGDERTAVLDCTSGWAVECRWGGVSLERVLEAAGLPGIGDDTRIEVRSVTGWSTSLSAPDARRALLAWEVEGRPLPVANGAPLRLVAPDRRGLEWVKWVDRIRLG